MLLSSLMEKPLLGSVLSSLIPAILKVPITQGLKWQITSIQEGKTKSQLVTVDGSQGVSDWFDLSGNSLNGSQTTSTQRPIYTLNALNGRPALVFDSVDDIINFPSILTATTTPFTLFVVAKFSTGTLLTMSGRDALRVSGGGNIVSNISSPNFAGATISSEAQIYVLRTEEIVAPSFNQRIYTDGVLGRSETRTITAGGGTWEVGDATDASIGEVLAYDRALSDAERSAVDNYLAAKFGITLP